MKNKFVSEISFLVIVIACGFSICSGEEWGDGQTPLSEKIWGSENIRLATYCDADPLKGRWILSKDHRFKTGNSCYLSLSENYLGKPPRKTQWVQHKYGEQVPNPSDFESKVEISPKQLFVRIPQDPEGKGKREVKVEIRMVSFGKDEFGELSKRMGYNEWDGVINKSMDDSEQVMSIPFDKLPYEPFQLRVSVTHASGVGIKKLVVDFN
jgi:hypothetical protein